MEKIAKDFWGKEILLCGCEQTDVNFCKTLQKTFAENGVEVSVVLPAPETELEFPTYPDLGGLPHVPACAYVMAKKDAVPGLVEELRQAGVSRIVVYNKGRVDEDFVAECEKNGVEIRAGCPLMLYRGFPCAMHASFAGVGKERDKS